MAGTTFNLPNYTGDIINLSPQDTPFLTAIAGISAENFDGTLAGAEIEASTHFQWQTTSLRAAADDRQRLEGADAPTATEQARANVFNVLEIHQEALTLSYSKLSAIQNLAATGAAHPNAQGVGGSNPVASEAAFQLRAHLAQIARDIEATFLTGNFQDPADNTTARQTRGLIEAIVTNTTAAAAAALTKAMVDNAMQQAWTQGGLTEGATAALLCNAFQKRALTALYLPAGAQPLSRTVGGVNVQTIETDFGTLNIMLDRYMPADTVVVCSLEQCRPHVLDVADLGPGFSIEELAKTGSAKKWQVYGEIGLEYGNEKAHAKITGLAIA